MRSGRQLILKVAYLCFFVEESEIGCMNSALVISKLYFITVQR